MLEQEINRLLADIATAPLYDRQQFKYLCDLQAAAAKLACNNIAFAVWHEATENISTLHDQQELEKYAAALLTEGGEWIEIPFSPSGPRPAGHDRPGTLGTNG